MGKDLDVIFISFVISREILKTLQLLSGKVSAQIFLFQYADDFDTEYMNYLIRQIYTLNQIPTIISVANTSDREELNRLERDLDFSQRIKIIPFDPELGHRMIRKILISLKPVEEISEKEQSESEEDEAK